MDPYAAALDLAFGDRQTLLDERYRGDFIRRVVSFRCVSKGPSLLVGHLR
jgi:hypothetical protein